MIMSWSWLFVYNKTVNLWFYQVAHFLPIMLMNFIIVDMTGPFCTRTSVSSEWGFFKCTNKFGNVEKLEKKISSSFVNNPIDLIYVRSFAYYFSCLLQLTQTLFRRKIQKHPLYSIRTFIHFLKSILAYSIISNFG